MQRKVWYSILGVDAMSLLLKNLLLKKWIKSIQTAGYNGARTVYIIFKLADRMRSMQTNGASKNRD